MTYKPQTFTEWLHDNPDGNEKLVLSHDAMTATYIALELMKNILEDIYKNADSDKYVKGYVTATLKMFDYQTKGDE